MLLTDSKTKIMKAVIKNLSAICIAIILCQAVIAQPAYSDISISAISLSAAGAVKKVPAVSKSNNPADHPVTTTIADDILKCSITVSNVSSANAFGAKLIIVLPAGAYVTVATLPSNATLVSDRLATGAGGGPGYILFDLKVIFSNQPVTVEFTFNRAPVANKLSAFVFCGVPDTNTVNNYKESTY
jgi:hypothetical protein